MIDCLIFYLIATLIFQITIEDKFFILISLLQANSHDNILLQIISLAHCEQKMQKSVSIDGNNNIQLYYTI